jgi:urease accessory protein
MSEGRAELVQDFHVSDGAWLEYFPSSLIPQTGSCYRQATHVSVCTEAELFFVETLAPGRVAHGECFMFAEIDWEFDFRVDDRLLARERFHLGSGDHSLTSWRAIYPAAYYTSAWLFSQRTTADAKAWDVIRAFRSETAMLGVSQIAPGLWSLKLLAADSITATKTLQAVRNALAGEIPELRCTARKL